MRNRKPPRRKNKYERRCKSCFGLLKRGPVNKALTRQKFWCPECRVHWEWQYNPRMDNSVCAIHKSQDEGFSYVSMNNDPCCGTFGVPPAMDGSEQYHHDAAPARPDFVRPVFAYLDGKPIAKWHWGQGKWLDIPKAF